MKKYLYIGLFIIIIVWAFVLNRQSQNEDRRVPPTPPEKNIVAASPLDLTYEVDEEMITLVKGKASEEAAPGSAAIITTEVFGEPVTGDIGAGPDSSVMFLIQRSGGTGVFIYVVAAYTEAGQFKGSKAYFVGDRISPQNIRISNGVIEVNYATRKENEPMYAEPTVGVTKYLVLKDGELQEK